VTQSFKKLRNEMPASRQARIAARTDELLASLPLHEIRQARKLSQEELAARLHVNQAAVSKVEHRTDLYISTLRKHIEAMGGTLIIQVDFPEGRYQLETFGRIREERADLGGKLEEASARHRGNHRGTRK
jgi:ribosome-binding protein aMBF1 (putative translation factor)